MELWTAFTIGFLGSLHCVGMCGPIAMSLPYQGSSRVATWANVALYNGGRIATYAVIGILPGLLGLGLSLSGVQKNVSLALGILFLAAAIVSVGILRFPKNWQVFLPLYNWVQRKLSDLLGKRFHGTFFTIGLVNGLLPCGLIYMALAAALTQFDVFASMLYMIFFGLGTVPLMFLVASSQKLISLRIRTLLRKSIPIFMLFFAALLIYRGLYMPLPETIDTWFILGSIPMCE
ncbi:MAG: sulfite exporter TauE/SafE family protein [Saprospiraceae bacterium]|nr:sulfite exporter TauE/SafE family protein [Saprospiraceae bacterium]